MSVVDMPTVGPESEKRRMSVPKEPVDTDIDSNVAKSDVTKMEDFGVLQASASASSHPSTTADPLLVPQTVAAKPEEAPAAGASFR